MAQKKNAPRERQIGKKSQEKKHIIDPRYKNTFWTVILLIVLIIFFIVNNTKSEPDNGPLPPGYNPQNLQERLNSEVPDEVKVTKSNESK